MNHETERGLAPMSEGSFNAGQKRQLYMWA